MLLVDWLEWIGNIMLPHSRLTCTCADRHTQASSSDDPFCFACVPFLLVLLTLVAVNYAVVIMVKKLQGRNMVLYKEGLSSLLPTFAF